MPSRGARVERRGSPPLSSQRQCAEDTLSSRPAHSPSLTKTWLLIFNKNLFVAEVWLPACLPPPGVGLRGWEAPWGSWRGLSEDEAGEAKRATGVGGWGPHPPPPAFLGRGSAEAPETPNPQRGTHMPAFPEGLGFSWCSEGGRDRLRKTQGLNWRGIPRGTGDPHAERLATGVRRMLVSWPKPQLRRVLQPGGAGGQGTTDRRLRGFRQTVWDPCPLGTRKEGSTPSFFHSTNTI